MTTRRFFRVRFLATMPGEVRWWHRLFRVQPAPRPVWGSVYVSPDAGGECDTALAARVIHRAMGDSVLSFGGVEIEPVDLNAPRLGERRS